MRWFVIAFTLLCADEPTAQPPPRGEPARHQTPAPEQPPKVEAAQSPKPGPFLPTKIPDLSLDMNAVQGRLFFFEVARDDASPFILVSPDPDKVVVEELVSQTPGRRRFQLLGYDAGTYKIPVVIIAPGPPPTPAIYERITFTVAPVKPLPTPPTPPDPKPAPPTPPTPPDPKPAPPEPERPVKQQKLFFQLIEETKEAAANRGKFFANKSLHDRMVAKGHRFRTSDQNIVRGSDNQVPADLAPYLNEAKRMVDAGEAKLPILIVVPIAGGGPVYKGNAPKTPEEMEKLMDKIGG